MREEQVTKALLKWLMDNLWQIVCFDFPQSGTGRVLHPDENNEKNKDSIIPDIVAVKNGVCLFFENKDRYYYPDYEKQHTMIVGNAYSKAVSELLRGHTISNIYYGIGLPTSKHKRGSATAADLVDFVVCVDDNQTVHIVHNPMNIPF